MTCCNYYHIRIHYYESDCGDDIVRFTVPSDVTEEQLISALDESKIKPVTEEDDELDVITKADEMLEAAAIKLNGEWEYISTIDTIDVK